MTIGSARPDGQMHRVTLRLPEQMDEWLDELEETGYFANRTEAARCGLRRLDRDPELLHRRKRKWRHAGGPRFTFRVPEALAASVNQFEDAGVAKSAAHVVRVGIAVLAEEYLSNPRSRRSFR